MFHGIILSLGRSRAAALIPPMQSDDPKFICQHLAEEATDGYRYRFAWFTGYGRDLNWTCEDCAKSYPTAPEPWLPATPDWLAKNRDKIYWRGICGSPEFKHRQSGLSFSIRDLELEGGLGPFVDVRPVLGSPTCWQALSSNGRLVLFSTQEVKIITSVSLEDLGFEIVVGTGLCISPDNEFAVVFQVSGPNAALVNVKTGKIILKLSRGDYHCERSHFPAAFFRHEDRTYLIAASDWNRLDLYDPATGVMLSERGPTCYVNKERPPHYLDYFHGGLCVSPDQQFVVDNGWVWGGAGILRGWELPAWLHNEWESEDGPTTRVLAWREAWDEPVCWIDNFTLASWGWGDEEWMMPAAVLIDVRDGKQLQWFPGPKVRMSRAWPPVGLAESFFFDRYLFAVHDDIGTTVWDIKSGECLLTDPQVKPWRYHPGSKEFIEITLNGFRVGTLVG